MCLIVDNNVVDQVLRGEDPDFTTLRDALFGRSKTRVQIAYGGRLRREYERSPALLRIVAALDRAGRAFKVSDEAVDAEEVVVASSGVCESDDPHVIALARVAEVRLLCSHDQQLHADFTNPNLLNHPRGKIYQNTSHDHLLRTHCR
jgi:hypothetical protein